MISAMIAGRGQASVKRHLWGAEQATTSWGIAEEGVKLRPTPVQPLGRSLGVDLAGRGCHSRRRLAGAPGN